MIILEKIDIENFGELIKNPNTIVLVDRFPAMIKLDNGDIGLLAHKEYNLTNMQSTSNQLQVIDPLGVYISMKMVLPIGIKPLYIEPEKYGYFVKLIDSTVPFKYYQYPDGEVTKQIYDKIDLNICIDLNLARYLNKSKIHDSLVIKKETPILKLDFLKCYNNVEEVSDLYIVSNNEIYENFMEFF